MAKVLGQDIYVPNDVIRQKDDWVALSAWAEGEPLEDGGIPQGVSGLPIPDGLASALVVGMRRAARAELWTPVTLIVEECIINARGGTKNVLARRSQWPERSLTWAAPISCGYTLFLTADLTLTFSEQGRSPKNVDLTAVGFPPGEDPYPQVTLTRVMPSGYDEAYLLGDIYAQSGSSARSVLFWFKAGKVTPVEMLPPPGVYPSATSFHNYTVNQGDVWTDYCGHLMFRGWTQTNTSEHYALSSGKASISNWGQFSQLVDFSLFNPSVIGPNMTLNLRFGLDRAGTITDTHPRCILSATSGTTTLDIASTSIYGQAHAKTPTITKLGNRIALVIMPRVWRLGHGTSTTYNTGFLASIPSNYWATETTLQGGATLVKSQEIVVTDGVGVVPLFGGVEYNRDVVTIPIGRGKALIFFSRNQGFTEGANQGFIPEVNYFDGQVAHQINLNDIHPDVEGFCIGDGVAMFLTGNADTSSPRKWYMFRGGLLNTIGVDPHALAGSYGAPMVVRAPIAPGITAFAQHYLNAETSAVTQSFLWVVSVDGSYSALPVQVGGVPQVVQAIFPLGSAALLITYGTAPNTFRYMYLALTDGVPTLELIGDVDGSTPPPAVRVRRNAVVIKTTEGVRMISAGPTITEITPPVEAGDLAPIGEDFVMFKPSTILDLRPGILASSGAI